jgi:GNAT superfamily N-acetyltransferase
MALTIRPGQASDSLALSEIALRAKAYWPYDEQFIQDCADDLRISPERASSGLIFVAEEDGTIVGFYGFGSDDSNPEMTHLFVSPEKIGKGFGKKLWNEAIAFAKSRRWDSFEILADPYATEKFYQPMGCRKIGEIESSVRPGRKLPLLRFDCRE